VPCPRDIHALHAQEKRSESERASERAKEEMLARAFAYTGARRSSSASNAPRGTKWFAYEARDKSMPLKLDAGTE